MTLFAALNAARGAAQQVGLLHPLFNFLGQFANYNIPVVLPTAFDAWQAFASGNMSAARASHVMKIQGVSMSPEGLSASLTGNLGGPTSGGYQGLWREIFESKVSVASPGELLAMLNQEILTRQQFDARMKQQGFWWAPYVTEMVKAAQNRIPDPSDLVRFAVRDVWSPDVVNRFQYDAEFPALFKTFMGRMGFDGAATDHKPGEAPAGSPTWSQVFWRAHWANISPGQAYEMFQRLRPNRVADLQAIFPDLRAFTLEDLNTVLRVNDYPIPFRAQLAAIAYHKPRLVDIDRFYSDGAITEDEAYEYHLDLGYSPRDARLRTNWLATKKSKAISGDSKKEAVKRIADLYEVGQLDRADAWSMLAELITGMPMQEALNDNVRGFHVTLWEKHRRQISAILNNIDSKQQLNNAKLMLKTWRSRYLRGMVNAGQLRVDMLRGGFQDAFITQFTNRLNTELAGGKLMLSTAKIRQLVVDGILPVETARKYLENLGWKNPELQYLIAQLQRDVELEQLRQAERDARDRRTQEETQMKLARMASQKRRQVVQRLNRQATPAALRRYFVHAVITESEYERELHRRGFTDASIKNILQDAKLARAEYLEKRGRRERRNAPQGEGANQPVQPAPEAPPQQPIGP